MPIEIKLSDAEAYDDLVQNSAPTGGMLTIATKRKMTAKRLPGVVFAFESEVDGKVVRVQHAVTLREFLSAALACAAHHETFDPDWQAGDTPHISTLG